MGPHFGPQKMLDLPTLSEAVDKALGDLASLTSETTDSELLLGSASLVRPGSAARREICQKAVKARPEYSAIAAVLTLTLDRVDRESVDELIKCDPDNALGYYLAAHLLYASDRDAEALEFFRRGAHCSELRLYEPITGPAIFKAIDELKLQGRDRLCALAWMACRSSNFNSRVLQFLSWPLSDWGRSGGLADREEIAQLLIVLAGHLFATNFYNRWAARQALESAVFGLKAKVPGPEKFSACIVNGSATQGVVGAMLRWPGANTAGDCAEDFKPLRLAQFLPDKIYRAFATVDPEKVKSAKFDGAKSKLSPGRKAAFERGSNELVRTSRDLIDVVLTDVDGIMSPYLKGIAVKRNDADGRSVVPFRSDVEKLVVNKPEVFAAAAANLQAMNALWDFDANDPERRNILRMMEINRALHSYAASHGDRYPQSLDVLFEQGYLKPPVEPVSVLSGKQYIYLAAGAKVPEKSKDKSHFIVLYDPTPDQWGYHQCTYASWRAGSVPPEGLKAHITAL